MKGKAPKQLDLICIRGIDVVRDKIKGFAQKKINLLAGKPYKLYIGFNSQYRNS